MNYSDSFGYGIPPESSAHNLLLRRSVSTADHQRTRSSKKAEGYVDSRSGITVSKSNPQLDVLSVTNKPSPSIEVDGYGHPMFLLRPAENRYLLEITYFAKLPLDYMGTDKLTLVFFHLTIISALLCQ